MPTAKSYFPGGWGSVASENTRATAIIWQVVPVHLCISSSSRQLKWPLRQSPKNKSSASRFVGWQEIAAEGVTYTRPVVGSLKLAQQRLGFAASSLTSGFSRLREA